MKKYEQYKDSGVAWIGDIPSHWDAIKPKYLVNLQKGTKPKELTDEANGNLPYLTMDVLRDRANKTITYPITVNDLVRVKDGDILVLWDGANAGEVLLAKEGYLSSTMACFGFDTDKLNSQYWFYFLKGLEPILKEFAGGTTIPHLDSSKIMEEAYPIPSMEEQQAIVRFLDYKVAKIDQLITESEAQIEELGKYKTAMISEVVTKGLNPDAPMRDSGIEWIGKIPEYWETTYLKHFCKVNSGREIDVELDSTDISAIPVYGSGGVFKYTDRPQFTGESVMFGRKGTLGKPIYVNESFWAVDTMYYLTFGNKLNAKFAYYQLMAFNWDPFITQTALPSIVATDIVNTSFAFPPLNEQQIIVEYLDNKVAKIDQLIAENKSQIRQLNAYKTALISEAVTGQIDVRDWRKR